MLYDDVPMGRKPQPGVFCPEWHEPCSTAMAGHCGSCNVCPGCGAPVANASAHYDSQGRHRSPSRVRSSS